MAISTRAMYHYSELCRLREEPEDAVVPARRGHLSTCFAHLANIAFKLGRCLEWDPKAERFTNSEEANRHLHYEYRKPWPLT